MITIVFSKDRAMQLDAFLRSYYHYVPNGPAPCVLFLATTNRHLKAYDQVFQKSPKVRFVPQGPNFRDTLLSVLPWKEPVVFFVDDQIFIRPWDTYVPNGSILSLRLGLNLTHNYASGDSEQPLPQYMAYERDLIMWMWGEGQLAWRYPLSVDGHVFDPRIRSVIAQCDFHSPNTLESAMQRFIGPFLEETGVCYTKSKVVNVPWNIVQSDWHNRNAGGSAEELLQAWEEGYQIDITPYQELENVSVHQELALSLETRHAARVRHI